MHYIYDSYLLFIVSSVLAHLALTEHQLTAKAAGYEETKQVTLGQIPSLENNAKKPVYKSAEVRKTALRILSDHG